MTERGLGKLAVIHASMAEFGVFALRTATRSGAAAGQLGNQRSLGYLGRVRGGGTFL
jgi:hypothetical protein